MNLDIKTSVTAQRVLKGAAVALVIVKGVQMLLERRRQVVRKAHDDERVLLASEDSFPASDPPSFSPGTV